LKETSGFISVYYLLFIIIYFCLLLFFGFISLFLFFFFIFVQVALFLSVLPGGAKNAAKSKLKEQ
jgi:hypothetical protein